MLGKRPLTENEFRRLIDSAEIYFSFPVGIRERTIWMIEAHTGLRIGEVLHLKLRDVHDGTRIREVLDVKRHYTKTKQRGRYIPVSDALRQQLEVYITTITKWVPLTPNSPLWVSRKRHGKINDIINVAPTATSIRRSLKLLLRYLEIDSTEISTHSFRKLFASRIFAKSGNDLLMTQRALGHSSIRSTLHYLSSCDEKLDGMIKSLWDAVENEAGKL